MITQKQYQHTTRKVLVREIQELNEKIELLELKKMPYNKIRLVEYTNKVEKKLADLEVKYKSLFSEHMKMFTDVEPIFNYYINRNGDVKMNQAPELKKAVDFVIGVLKDGKL